MRARLASLLFAAVVVLAPTGAALFRVWVHHDAVAMGYQLSHEEGRRRELSLLEQQLEVELAAEKTPARLSRLAAQLGLLPAAPQQLLGAAATAASAGGGAHERP